MPPMTSHIVIAHCKQKFWENGEVPTVEEIAKELEITVEEATRYRVRKNVVDALAAFYVPAERDPRLTPKQIVWVNMLLNIEDPRSLRKKADDLGITIQEHNAWMKNKKFATHLQKRAFDLFGREKWQVFLSVLQSARHGDVQAQKLYLELTGDYVPQSKLNVKIDVQGTVGLLIEVIQRHCSAEQVAAIANEFDSVLSGQQLSAGPSPMALSPSQPDPIVEALSTPQVSVPAKKFISAEGF